MKTIAIIIIAVLLILAILRLFNIIPDEAPKVAGGDKRYKNYKTKEKNETK